MTSALLSKSQVLAEKQILFLTASSAQLTTINTLLRKFMNGLMRDKRITVNHAMSIVTLEHYFQKTPRRRDQCKIVLLIFEQEFELMEEVLQYVIKDEVRDRRKNKLFKYPEILSDLLASKESYNLHEYLKNQVLKSLDRQPNSTLTELINKLQAKRLPVEGEEWLSLPKPRHMMYVLYQVSKELKLVMEELMNENQVEYTFPGTPFGMDLFMKNSKLPDYQPVAEKVTKKSVIKRECILPCFFRLKGFLK